MKKGLLIRPILMMLLLLVSLSTATFAWFTVSNTASVDSMSLEAKAAGALYIVAGDSDDIVWTTDDKNANNEPSSAAKFTDYEGYLNSAISGGLTGTSDALALYVPTKGTGYEDSGQPTDYTAASSTTDEGKYYIEQTFTIYQESEVNTYIYLASESSVTDSTNGLDAAFKVAINSTDTAVDDVIYSTSTVEDDTEKAVGYNAISGVTYDLTTFQPTTQFSDLNSAAASKTTDAGYIGVTNLVTDDGDDDYVYLTFTVTVWLEGQDAACIDANIGSAAIGLSFVAFDAGLSA